MKKNPGKPKIKMPFDYMPPIPEDILSFVKNKLVETVTKMNLNRFFSIKFQAELIRNLAYSSRLNYEAFSEIYVKLKAEFQIFLGNVSSGVLFKFFDEDSDGYLNEDEQLLVFTVLLSKFYHLLEEVSFYSVYDLDPQIRQLIKGTIECTIELEKTLRNKFYEDQNTKFKKFKNIKVQQMENHQKIKFQDFENMKISKNCEFRLFQEKEEVNAIDKFKKKKSHFNFNKYADLRHFLIQEKLLGLTGEHEEAKNTFRNYQKFLDKELSLVQNHIESAFNQASKNFQKTCAFKHSILENKMLTEKEKIQIMQREKKTLLDKNLNVLENKLKIKQEQSTAQSAFNFLKMCKINMLKSENAMKKDFAMKINYNMKSIFQQEIIHSAVFKLVFQKMKLSLLIGDSEPEVLENLREIKNSNFNIRLSLRNLNDNCGKINVSSFKMKNDLLGNLEELCNQSGLPMLENNGLKLTLLYDDNLNEIK